MINGPHGDVWRWLAAFLAGVVLAGMPAAFVALTAPGRGEYDGLRTEIVTAQVQLARIEERLVQQDLADNAALATFERRLDELAALLAVERRQP